MASTVILGATGFLGAHVVAAAHADALARAGDRKPGRVVAVGRQTLFAPRFTPRREAAEWVSADLAPPDQAAALLEVEAPRRVILCAALSRVGDCEQDPELARRLNVELPAEVAGWCASNRARLVHVSTDLVFGDRAPRRGGFLESDPVGPVSVYGQTKAEGEEAVLSADPGAVVARLPLLYGNSGGRGLGASDSLLEAIDRGEVPRLFTDEWRTPLEVSVAAEALVELSRLDLKGRVHVAGPDRVSRHELALEVLDAMGLSREEAQASLQATLREEVETLGVRPADVSLDSTHAARRLRTPLVGVREGVRRATS